jgi:hypothetical protein
MLLAHPVYPVKLAPFFGNSKEANFNQFLRLFVSCKYKPEGFALTSV